MASPSRSRGRRRQHPEHGDATAHSPRSARPSRRRDAGAPRAVLARTQDDADSGSLDAESGLERPGLSVNPLEPEAWWTRPLEDWLARQLCQYRHLAEQQEDRFAWVLRGREVGRGPDCEPLLGEVEPVAQLDDALLDEAEARYRARFDAGRGPTD